MCPAISPGTLLRSSNATPGGLHGREWTRSFPRAEQTVAPLHGAAPQESNEDTDWYKVPIPSSRSACARGATWPLRLERSETVADHDRAFPSLIERKRCETATAIESCSTAIRRTGAARSVMFFAQTTARYVADCGSGAAPAYERGVGSFLTYRPSRCRLQ